MKHAYLAVFFVAATTTTLAAADDKAACLGAASKGQSLRDERKLVEAREQFRICAQQSCPGAVAQDCAGWLEGVEKSLPTVVLSATDASGAAKTDVKVTVDGAPFVSKLDGGAVPMNPGTHKFRFEFADGKVVERDVVVAQGQKDQTIMGALPRVQMTPPGGATATADTRNPSGGIPWKAVGWATAGAGAAGLAAGVVFGLMAMSDKSDASCNSRNQCLPGPLSDARSLAAAADIAFVAGGVLATAGLVMVIWGPKGNGAGERSTAVRMVPAIGARRGGVVLGGTF